MRIRNLMNKKKEGYSLVELVVVIALMAILVGLASLSIALLSASDSKGLASHINDSLTDLKAITESNSGPYYLHIYKASDGFYAVYDDKPNGSFTIPAGNAGATRLGSANFDLNACFSAGAHADISGDAVATISMQKKDGAFTGSSPEYFEIKKGDEVEYKIVLAKNTGLHYIE